MEHELVLVSPGDEVRLHAGRKARCFRSTHIVPTLGWCVLETRRKLKGDYAGAPREAILRAKEAGERIHDEVEAPLFVHCGDTTIDVLEREELPRRAQVLMLECTFLDESVGVAEARARGHVHLDEISGRPELFDEVGTLVLSHVSPRWSPRAARAILDARLPPRLREKCAYFLP
jgi:ribonuclease Z